MCEGPGGSDPEVLDGFPLRCGAGKERAFEEFTGDGEARGGDSESLTSRSTFVSPSSTLRRTKLPTPCPYCCSQI